MFDWLTPGLGSVISGGLSFLGGSRANSQAGQSALSQMMFQKEMSDTAHRREVADLRAAGLNPILSARYGGSSTPAGATWTPQNVLGPAAHSAVDTYQRMTEAESTRRNTKIKEPLEKAAGMVSTGIDAVQAVIPAVSAAVQSAVATALDKVEEVKGTALSVANMGRQSAEETKAVVQKVREIVNQPGGVGVSSARQIADVLFPNVKGNFPGMTGMDLARHVAATKDPVKRRELNVAAHNYFIKKHAPTFSRHGFR